MKAVITTLFLFVFGGLYSQTDTIILPKTVFKINERISFTVSSSSPKRFPLDGGCSNSQLAYILASYKPGYVGRDTMAIVYDNTRKIMECGLPYTLPLTLFTSSLKKGIEQPGEYFITVAVQDVGYQSVVFRVEE